MKIPKAVRTLALKHRVTVRRDHHGNYSVWASDRPDSVRWPLLAQSTSGAMAKVRQIARSYRRNPRRKAHRARHRRNPGAAARSARLWVLVARSNGTGVPLRYMGGSKFAREGRPVYFRSPEGAKVVAKLLRVQFPMLRRYAFYARAQR